MLPVIRKTPSWNNGLRKKLLHCFLLAVMLGLSFFLLRSCLRRGSRLEDFSGGRYERTFRTGNSVLKKELLSLKGPILEQEWKSSGMLERFHRLHRQIPSSMRQTPAAAEAESLPGAKGEKKEGEGTLSREEWLAEFHRLLGEIRRPLKGIGESAGEFSDFLEVLRSCAGERGNNAEFPDLPLKSLRIMFDYGYVMLFSDHPDVSYLESAVRSAESRIRERGLSEEERQFLAACVKRSLERPFPQRNLMVHGLLRSLRDYEKVRLNGLRLFLGEPKPGTSLKESLSGGEGSFGAAVKIWVRDFFYDVDRDQIQTIRMYRTFLNSRKFVSFREFETVLPHSPTRPMARREWNLFREEMRRQSEVIDGLRRLLLKLEPAAFSAEMRRSLVDGSELSGSI